VNWNMRSSDMVVVVAVAVMISMVVMNLWIS
jgi:hypothetical protein